MNKIQNSFAICVLVIVLFACNDNNTKQKNKYITLGDTSTIVTETDSSKLRNYVKDITPNANVSATQKVSNVMHVMDSAQKVNKLNTESTEIANTALSQIQLGAISMACSSPIVKQDSNYKYSSGEYANNMQIKVANVQDAKVEQRLYTQLYCTVGGTKYLLNDFGTFVCKWNSLPSKDNLFISNGTAEKKFFEVNNTRIKLAVERELRKAKISNKEILKQIATLDKTNAYSDAPCEVKVSSSQFKISGKINGQAVTKMCKIVAN